jgi:hypothetical protein
MWLYQKPVLRIQIRIRIRRIRMFLGLLDPDPGVWIQIRLRILRSSCKTRKKSLLFCDFCCLHLKLNIQLDKLICSVKSYPEVSKQNMNKPSVYTLFPLAREVVNTSGAPWVTFANFRKIWKGAFRDDQGTGEIWLMEKTWSQKSRDTVPLMKGQEKERLDSPLVTSRPFMSPTTD